VADPTWDYNLLPFAGFESDIVGSVISGPKSVSGITSVIDFSGGGMWTVKLSRVQVYSAPSHLFWNRLRTMLAGGVRRINIPFQTDLLIPATTIQTTSTFSDASTFSDGSVFSQDTVSGSVTGAQPLYDGTISLTVVNGKPLLGGETFSILHATKGNRVYQISDIDSQTTDGNGNPVYVVGIRPTLREATADGTPIEFVRPMCSMRLPAGATMPWSPQHYWEFTPDVTFIEDMS
jgi:hypothetical protein